MLTVGICPAQHPQQANALIPSRLSVVASNKVDPEIPGLWEVGFNVINCNRRRGQIIGAKVSL